MDPTSPRSSRLLAIALGTLLAAALAWGGWRALSTPDGNDAGSYRLAKVERGELALAVTGKGTVNAGVTVQVGSQISGQIRALYADFNTEVKKNQVIARIGPETYDARVKQAQADLDAARSAITLAQNHVIALRADIARARAAAADALRDYERRKTLVERGFIAPAEVDRGRGTYEQSLELVHAAEAQIAAQDAQVENARDTVTQREASLAHARANLERTYIRAPIGGTVISRSAETGQAVAAGVQGPPLFTIAKDLREMQVDASIDETDVGRLRVGQPAMFTVDAFPRRTFEGKVVQIRKAPQVVQNAVTYTVVVSAPNPDLVLLPGMTANVHIVIESRTDVLKVPTAALRFRPLGASDTRAPNDSSRVWVLNAVHRPEPVEVRTGLSDGASTEILSGRLTEGSEVIVGAGQAGAPPGIPR